MKTIPPYQQTTVQGGISTGLGLMGIAVVTTPIGLSTAGAIAVLNISVVAAISLYHWLKPKHA
jgi:hypothetical protein